ncbi:hypothetical protein C8J56DRAFT_903060 [Mycena floridula]|nr:hypothetical protein C8J56DRAFT_903060 [Mycena floridula]
MPPKAKTSTGKKPKEPLPPRPPSACERRPTPAGKAFAALSKSQPAKNLPSTARSPASSRSITPPPIVVASNSQIEECVAQVVPDTHFRVSHSSSIISISPFTPKSSPSGSRTSTRNDTEYIQSDDDEGSIAAVPAKAAKPRKAPIYEEEEEDEEEEDEEEEEENAGIDIDFAIAVDPTASEDITLSSNISFKSFLDTVTEQMDISVKDVRKLDLTYKFSTSKQADLPKLLRTAENFTKMIQQAKKELEAVKKGKGKKQPFSIQIQEKRKPVVKGAKGVKGQTNRKKRKRADSDSEEDDKPTGKSLAQYQVELKAKHLCPKCTTSKDTPVYCYLVGGKCVQMAEEIIVQWSAYLYKGYPSLDVPPAALALTDEQKRPKKAKLAPIIEPAAPAHPQIIYAMPPPPGYYGAPAPPHASSASPIKALSVSIYPTVLDWLISLDAGDRGIDDDNFSQYTDFFKDAGYRRLIDVSEMTVGDILETCPGMVKGIASVLSRYAIADRKVVESRARRP